MHTSIIVAVAENGVIGRAGALPWRLSGDLRRFKSLTMGHAIVMGRKTWQSIGRLLPGRRMIVVSRQPDYRPKVDGVAVAHDLTSALAMAKSAGDDEAFIIGGADLYREALPHAERLYLTRVHAVVEGDTRFPEFDSTAWRLVDANRQDADATNDYPFSAEVYHRV